MKCMRKAIVFALASAVIIASGALCGYAQNKPLSELDKKLEKANTLEKRDAIIQIRDLFRKYDRHYDAMDVVDMILEADRNVPTLAKLAEYAIVEGSSTLAYEEIAGYAAKAPRADREFLQIAELIKEQKNGIQAVKLARQAARAQTDAELQAVREGIAELEKKEPANRIDPEYLAKLEQKMRIARTDEQRQAISRIRDLFQRYNRHYLAMDIVDYILEADRNAPILARLAEYAITEGSATTVYIAIAGQAAKAPLADREFLRLAELVKKNDTGATRFADLARQAAQADTDTDLKEVRKKIAALGR